ncbi:hypothetical protein DFH07DRAFT_726096, partial [Mycena maculata]
AVRIEWAKTRARAMRWKEEVDLLEEEMRRTHAFHVWWAGWWRDRVGLRGLEEGPQLEGDTAYALRQMAVQTTLAEQCAKEWRHLPDLIRRGRAGELREEGVAVEGPVESDDDDRDEVDSDGEEEEPIPLLPRREVKGAYIDEVLAM